MGVLQLSSSALPTYKTYNELSNNFIIHRGKNLRADILLKLVKENTQRCRLVLFVSCCHYRKKIDTPANWDFVTF